MAETAEDLPVAARAEAVRFSRELGAAMVEAFHHGVRVARLVDAGYTQGQAMDRPEAKASERRAKEASYVIVAYLDDYAVLRAKGVTDGS